LHNLEEKPMADPVPQPISGVTPYIMVRGAAEASAFYQKAFGAQELVRMPAQDGKRLIHCHLRINGGDLMLSDEFPEQGYGLGEGPKGVTLHLAVDDADKWWDRAVVAGATITMPIAVQFWGDRYGQIKDPFGHSWSIGSPVRKQGHAD
jgi:PhnB protein